MLREFLIGQNNAPHDFGEHHPLSEIVVVDNQAGELKMVDGVSALGLGQCKELSGCRVVQPEVSVEGTLDVGPLRGTELPVRVGQLEE